MISPTLFCSISLLTCVLSPWVVPQRVRSVKKRTFRSALCADRAFFIVQSIGSLPQPVQSGCCFHKFQRPFLATACQPTYRPYQFPDQWPDSMFSFFFRQRLVLQCSQQHLGNLAAGIKRLIGMEFWFYLKLCGQISSISPSWVKIKATTMKVNCCFESFSVSITVGSTF